MEKYKKFTDKGTGINPFLPFTPKPPQGRTAVLQKLKAYFVSPVLAVIRIVLSLAILPVFCLLAVFLPWLTSWSWPVSRSIARPSNAILGRIWLTLLGFYRMPHIPFPFYEIRPNSFAYTPQNPDAKPDGSAPIPTRPQQLSPYARDLILATWTSYIDVLYFATHYAPIFAFPVGNGRVVARNAISALWYSSFGLDDILEGDKKVPAGTTLSELLMRAKRQHRPVVLFPEGTTTNGRRILQFDAGVFNTLTEVQRTNIAIQMVVCRYEATQFSPTFPVGSAAGHMLQLCCQLYNSLTVKYLRPSEIPALPAKGTCEKWCADVRHKFASAAPTVAVALSAADKVQFLDHWYSTQGEYKKLD